MHKDVAGLNHLMGSYIVAISFLGGGNLSTSSIMEKQISQSFLNEGSWVFKSNHKLTKRKRRIK
jgi:hypothetical protein